MPIYMAIHVSKMFLFMVATINSNLENLVSFHSFCLN